MRVVLIKDVPNFGEKDDIKDVKDGYGRNFLLKNKLAEILTPQREAYLKAKKERQEKIAAELKKQAGLLKEKVKNLNLVFKVKVGESGKSFGSVTVLKIQNELKKQGINVEKEQILTKSIKILGMSKVKIKLYPNIEAEINILVQPEK